MKLPTTFGSSLLTLRNQWTRRLAIRLNVVSGQSARAIPHGAVLTDAF
jgi:hypothetical protein